MGAATAMFTQLQGKSAALQPVPILPQAIRAPPLPPPGSTEYAATSFLRHPTSKHVCMLLQVVKKLWQPLAGLFFRLRDGREGDLLVVLGVVTFFS